LLLKIDDELRRAVFQSYGKEPDPSPLIDQKDPPADIASFVPDWLAPMIEDGGFAIISEAEYYSIPYELTPYIHVVRR
jgi:hypothetical protein